MVGQDTLKHVSNSGCVGRAHLLPQLGGLIVHEAGFGSLQTSVCVTVIVAVPRQGVCCARCSFSMGRAWSRKCSVFAWQDTVLQP